MKNRRIRMVS